MNLFHWFRPAAHRPRLPQAEIDRRYPRLRWQIFESAFIAYAAFYIVRNNFAPVSKEIVFVAPKIMRVVRSNV